MTPFVNELGKKLAERWMATLVFPGVLFLAASAVAVVLGHGAALNGTELASRTGRWAAAVSRWPAVGQGTALVGVVLGSVVVATAIRATSDSVVLKLWLGHWPRPLAARRTARRAARWRTLLDELAALRAVAPPGERSPRQVRDLEKLSARRDRIALAAPTEPTFTGDRLAGTATRVRNQYGIDLVSCWMRLWVLFPDDVRVELRTARERLDTAVAGTTWAAAYALLASVWWPAGVAAAVIWAVSWRRGRRAADDHAALVESTVDIFGRRLAVELGLIESGVPLDSETGTRVTRIVRKGS